MFVKAAVSGVVREGVDRRGADRPDDPAVPGQLALDRDHRDLDPAGDPVVADRALSAHRPDAQHHDAGRPGAGGRHPGRRRHGDHREHQLAPGAGQGRRRRRSSTARSRSCTPAFVSLLCICIVFVPMFFLPGVAGFLFVPLAEAVVFAMIASFILSRTLVPTMAMYLLQAACTATARRARARADAQSARALPARLRARASSASATRYRGLLGAGARQRRGCSSSASWLSCCCRSLLVPFLGANFFPAVDAGQITLHVRAPVGTRIEETAALVRPDRSARSARSSRRTSWRSIVDNIGLPISAHQHGLQQLRHDRPAGRRHPDHARTKDHAPTADYVAHAARACCRALSRHDLLLPAGRHRQPDPEFRRAGADRRADRRHRHGDATAAYAHASCCARSRTIPGVADARMQQSVALSAARRRRRPHARIGQLGLTERDVTNSAGDHRWPAASRPRRPSGSIPRTACPIRIVAQTPRIPGRLAGRRCRTCPITGATAGSSQVLGGLGTIQPQHSDAGGVALQHPAGDRHLRHHPGPRPGRASPATCSKVIDDDAQGPAAGRDRRRCAARSQTMNTAFSGLFFGLLGGDRADLPADRGELPVLARSVRHHHRAAGGAGRHRLDAVRHRHDPVACRR